jgi:23S rRNA (guanosine2251-2'-O)-methyltransferase
MTSHPDNPGQRYRERKAAFERCLTVYGRRTVLEALLCPHVRCERLHLAASNKSAPALEEIETLARAQGADILSYSREELARVSRNGREDQGVAADVRWDGYAQLTDLMPKPPVAGAYLIAADGLNNPQNLGMLIRSAAAGGCDGILIPRRGGCDISPLVIKASAGAIFRAPIIRCDTLAQALTDLRGCGWKICLLEAGARRSLFDVQRAPASVFVLGAESAGISAAVRALADEAFHIPMHNGIESLNVAVTAALVAYRRLLAGL